MKRTILIKDPVTGYQRKCVGVEDKPFQTDIDKVLNTHTSAIECAKDAFAELIAELEAATDGVVIYDYDALESDLQEDKRLKKSYRTTLDEDDNGIDKEYLYYRKVKKRLIVEYLD